MQKYRHLVVTLGLILNALGGVFVTLVIIKYYREWDTLSIKPDAKYAYRLLQIVFYQGLPMCAITMALSVTMFWILRKGPHEP